MTWVAAAIVTSAAVSAYSANKAAGKAAGATERAADTSANVQREMFERQVALQEPWRQAGMGALNKLIPLAESYTPFTAASMLQEPGYQFRLSEGLKAMERGAAARGGLQSGAALKAAQRYGQEYASGEYQNAFNRYQAERQARLGPLQSLAGVGQTTAQALGGAAGTLGANLGQTYMTGGIGAGQARASGYLGQANALTGALGTGLNYFQNQQLMSRLFPQGGLGAGSPQYTYGEGYIPYGTSVGE